VRCSSERSNGSPELIEQLKGTMNTHLLTRKFIKPVLAAALTCILTSALSQVAPPPGLPAPNIPPNPSQPAPAPAEPPGIDEPMLSWEPDGEGVRIVTANRTCRASRLLISAGAWVGGLLPALHLPLKIERQILFWFEPRARSEDFQPQNCPIYLWEYASGKFFYGFPDLGDGVKVAFHHQGEAAQPDRVRREVEASEIEQMRQLLRRFLPAAEGRLKAAAVCLYTNTPDEHFILDFHPIHPQVLIASPCSGHGFKFSSVIGEIASTLLCNESSPLDLSLFKLERFSKPNGRSLP